MRQTFRVCHGSDPGVSHPHAGFLAPLELAGLLHPAAVRVPLPSERSPRVRSRTPRRGRWLPCRSSRSNPGAACAVLSLVAFTRLGRRSGVVPRRILPELEAPFQPRSSHSLAAARLARPPGHPGPRTPDSPRSGRSVDFEAFFPARVRSHHAAVTRRAEAGALLGVLAPPEPCSRQTWGPLTRHGRRRPSSRWHRAPLGASCDPGDPRASVHASGSSWGRGQECCGAGDPRCRVGSREDDRIVSPDPSAVTEHLDEEVNPGRAALRQQPRLP